MSGDLDAAFLDFIRAEDPEAHRRIHGDYVQLFAGRARVVDLACGEGAFVALLDEAGHTAIGVDSDPGCVRAARARGVDVVEADVLEWLAAQPAGSVDGVFNAHLVEHLPYGPVLELYRAAHRVLAPEGVLVTVTPNVRALYSHLETFYQHFGHVTFYHPRLLSFFAEQAGFARSEAGENPRLAAPMFGVREGSATPTRPPVRLDAAPLPRYRPRLPAPRGPLGALWGRLKNALARLVVRPFLDPLVADLHAALAAAEADRARLASALAELDVATAARLDALRERHDRDVGRLDRSYEAYVVSYKAGTASAMTETEVDGSGEADEGGAS